MLSDLRVAVRPGAGLVARVPSALLVLQDPSDGVVVSRLLDELRAEGGGAGLSERLSRVVAEMGAEHVPPLCAVADGPAGLSVYVHRQVLVSMIGGQPSLQLGAIEGPGWAQNANGMGSMVIGFDGSVAPDASNPWLDLRDGVVSGSGVLLVPSGVAVPPMAVSSPYMASASPSPSPAPAPVMAEPAIAAPAPVIAAAPAPQPAPAPVMAQPAPAPVMAPVSVPMAEPAPAPAMAQAAPAPSPAMAQPAPVMAQPTPAPASVMAQPAPTQAVATEPPKEVLVWGINCKRGHFNNPDARYCRLCGMNMVHIAKDLVLGPRPVIGYLTTDDGATYKLDSDYIIGADPNLGSPEVKDLVGGAPVRPLALTDAQGTVSPTHAVIHLEEWEVSITDRGSLYGTHVWTPGTTEWVRLAPGQSLALAPRSHVRVGARELTFEPVNRR